MNNTAPIKEFQKMIFVWWRTNRRDLPWRHTSNPYYILVSEIMLQQTQVFRVRTKYLEFIQRFPSIISLAEAKTSDVLKLWKGMGYNRRALYLKKTAQTIVVDHHGIFPESEMSLMKLPGIGKYTARAILVFSFRQDIAMVDTNVRKIITHFFFDDVVQPEKIIDAKAEELAPKGKAWEWHQALMDYGAMNARVLRPLRADQINKKKSIPFRESIRFFRGRIMDLVRNQTWDESTLVQVMIDTYGKNSIFYTKCIDGLLQEGLLTRLPGDIISLPE